MSFKIFLAVCMSILTGSAYAVSATETQDLLCALGKPSSIPPFVAHQDRKSDSIRDNDLDVAAGILRQETLRILSTLQPTAVLTQQRIDKNKHKVDSLFFTIAMMEDLFTLFNTLRFGTQIPSTASDTQLTRQAANKLYEAIRLRTIPNVQRATVGQVHMLRIHRQMLTDIIKVWSPNHHFPFMRSLVQQLLDINTCARLASAEQTTVLNN